MTANELQKRNEKADSLRVLQTDDGPFFMESSQGKILYSVAIRYEETDALRRVLEGIRGRKFKLDCGHHVTFGHGLQGSPIRSGLWLRDRFQTA